MTTISEYSYFYVNQKIIEIQNFISNDYDSNILKNSKKFEYDNNGKIKQYIEFRADGSQLIRKFANGIQIAYIEIDKTGKVNDISNSFNSLGYFHTQVTTAGEEKFIYDLNGNLKRKDIWKEGLKKSYTEYEYENTRYLQSLAIIGYNNFTVLPGTKGSNNNMLSTSKTYVYSENLKKII
ncbi:MAG: hypothetical protein ACRCVT_00585 [Leadbetterella sp.]